MISFWGGGSARVPLPPLELPVGTMRPLNCTGCTYETSTPAPDEEQKRRDEVEEKECGGSQ